MYNILNILLLGKDEVVLEYLSYKNIIRRSIRLPDKLI